ncbi:MAG: EAL domain-containing protein [Rhodanobacteraceae bacterium]|nr:EAL domain-containing protein [Rhodanobacteraceae bacterium]
MAGFLAWCGLRGFFSAFVFGAGFFGLLSAGVFGRFFSCLLRRWPPFFLCCCVLGVAGIIQVAVRLNIEVIAEGIESVDEREVLIALGVRYMQGYLFAHPGFEALVQPVFP